MILARIIVLGLVLCASQYAKADCSKADVEWLLSKGFTPSEARAQCGESNATPEKITATKGNTSTLLTQKAVQASAPKDAPVAAATDTPPTVPTIGAAKAGNGQATIEFTPVSQSGTSFVATSQPGGLTGACSNSPCTVLGLKNGTVYAFTVQAKKGDALSAQSGSSNSVTPSPAQTDTHIQDAFTVSQANQDYTGDYYWPQANVAATTMDGKSYVCIPAGTKLLGQSKENSAGATFVIDIKNLSDEQRSAFAGAKCIVPSTVSSGDTITLDQLTGVELLIPKADVDRIQAYRRGLTYGLLAVPFKYYSSGSKNLSDSTTIGPYIGWRSSVIDNPLFNSADIKLIAFAGPSTVAVSQAGSASNATSNVSAISYGLGVLTEIKNGFQAGVVFGRDMTGNNSNFPDNNKTWISFGVGYSFSN